MADSSTMVTPDLRLTCCVLVRDGNCSTPNVTPAATRAVSAITATRAMIRRTYCSLGSDGQELRLGSVGYHVRTSCRLASNPADRERRTAPSLSGRVQT